jgi:hypothetical protein
MTMIDNSDDAKVTELLAPLRRLEPVPFAGPRDVRRPLLRRRPALVALVVVVALALTGVAIADGVGAFNGLSAAQHTQTGASVLDPATLAAIKEQNDMATEDGGMQLLPNTARILSRLPDGSPIYALTDTRGDLCILSEGAGSCTSPLNQAHPISVTFGNDSPTTGGTFIASGFAIDGVSSVSFTVRGQGVTAPVKNNTWDYEESNSHAIEGRCIMVHFADGSTVNYPPTLCP